MSERRTHKLTPIELGLTGLAIAAGSAAILRLSGFVYGGPAEPAPAPTPMVQSPSLDALRDMELARKMREEAFVKAQEAQAEAEAQAKRKEKLDVILTDPLFSSWRAEFTDKTKAGGKITLTELTHPAITPRVTYSSFPRLLARQFPSDSSDTAYFDELSLLPGDEVGADFRVTTIVGERRFNWLVLVYESGVQGVRKLAFYGESETTRDDNLSLVTKTFIDTQFKNTRQIPLPEDIQPY